MTDWIGKVINEYEAATKKFGKFNSTHEGYAVIKEELDELWDEIKTNSPSKTLAEEAVQVTAMGLRFLNDCCGSIEQPIPTNVETKCEHCGAETVLRPSTLHDPKCPDFPHR